MNPEARRIAVRGTVQGVGFRPWVHHLAERLGIRGSVWNEPGGVTIEAHGPGPALDALLAALAAPPPGAEVERIEWAPLAGEAPADFTIAESRGGGPRAPTLPPDLATCEACMAEVADAGARRSGYAFTNCTRCGPRFSIATALPYDRPNTTMADFPLCDDCRREYEDPRDRRFHAQPIACPRCGPRLRWLDAAGREVAEVDPLGAAADAIAAGAIVAVHGLGGVHLAVDARQADAVAELRRRKRREEKPLAVMVPSLEAARALAVLDEAERVALESPARPIVLARARPEAALAPAVAPDTDRLGLLLPYTPLHALLLARLDRPLVMTSGNVSDEPMATDPEEALARLRGLADGFLLHDRPIASRVDDSVVRVIAGAPRVLRRARGYVPGAVRVAAPFPAVVLAVGGHLKNTFCFGVGEHAVLGPHVGDLDELRALEDFEAAVARLGGFLGARPAVLAHDLHPGYASTAYAKAHGERLVGVQHHHAHVAAVIAERHLEGEVLGVAYDGTGYGADGAAWGGELLIADLAGYTRVGTFRPLRLAGGERAIREVWRAALSALADAFPEGAPLERLELFRRVPAGARAVVGRMLETGVGVVPAHGVGRIFDAAAALITGRPHAAYEAQLAMALEALAGEVRAGSLPFRVERDTVPLVIDLRPMWRALVEGILGGRAAPELAAAVHETIVAATAEAIALIEATRGARPRVLAGGCFQNGRLLAGLAAGAHAAHAVPTNDGGLALGQAVIAGAWLARGGLG